MKILLAAEVGTRMRKWKEETRGTTNKPRTVLAKLQKAPTEHIACICICIFRCKPETDYTTLVASLVERLFERCGFARFVTVVGMRHCSVFAHQTGSLGVGLRGRGCRIFWKGVFVLACAEVIETFGVSEDNPHI